MSWPRLCALLGELGFEGAERLDPDSFEWPFQYDDARTILFWICSSHRPSNVLSFFELFHYEQFVEEGKLLEGEDLDFAYDSISAFSSRRDNQEAVFGAEEGLKDIRDATVAYKAEALELQKQLRHLQSQLDMLTGQASALIQGRRARVAAMSTMNEVLGRIASTAQELAHYHSGDIVAQDNACLTVGERKSRGKVFSVACDLLMNFYSLSIRAEEGIYLAYSDFHSYLVGDSSCIKELNQWFAKQLDMIVKHHSQDVGLRRRVLVDFFCNPEPLGSQVWELTARV